MRYLGIDYGTKQIGLALSDTAGQFAFPYTVLENRGVARAVDTVNHLCRKESVTAIVIGESKDFKGKDNGIMCEARQFAGELSEVTGLPIEWMDETFTSALASRDQNSGALIDASAAALILRSYLEREQHKT